MLVCPFTNPAWTPLFEVAVAAVVDTGSVGSHAAITAREYGIPAVMATGSGTTVLSDDQRVEVDGAPDWCGRRPRPNPVTASAATCGRLFRAAYARLILMWLPQPAMEHQRRTWLREAS